MRCDMNINDIAAKLELTAVTSIDTAGLSVTAGYAGDLLSDVLAHAEPGALWITIQKHGNILGVASAKDLSAIIISEGVIPEKELTETAERRNIPVFTSRESTFTLSGKLYALLQEHDLQD